MKVPANSDSQNPAQSNIGRKRLTDIYVGGLSGQTLSVPVDFHALEARAKESMAPEAFAYVAGGAGMETTMLENRRAFDKWRIVPRMLRDVSERDTSIELFGKKLPTPFLTAPVGVLEMAHDDADLAVARACRAEEIPMIFSNQASFSMEECAAEMGRAERWFQLYWSASNDLVESLVARAENAGCSAIVVTLDTTLLGWRTRDLDLAYLPFLRGKGIAQYTSDPVFRALLKQKSSDQEVAPERTINLNTIRVLLELAERYPDKFLKNLTSGEPLAAVRKFIGIYSRPSLTWDDLQFLRERTHLPILLKGILHPDDARQAVDKGMDGIVVSNHGGRQVDGAIGALDALPGVVDAVENQIPVLFDSGVRTGADAFKALALGARAVCIGRPYVYGLAAGGQQGVQDVLHNFKADFDLTMGLAGCRSIAEIDRVALHKST